MAGNATKVTNGRKLKVAILYNEPLVGAEAGRKYITEKGELKEGPPAQKRTRRTKVVEKPQMVDYSEVGVLQEMEDLKEALISLGYKPTIFNVDSDVFRLIDFLKNEKPDLVFNIVESLGNEAIHEMNVAALYELFGIPYTGAGPLTLGISLNKPRVKELLSYHGIRTPKFQVFGLLDKVILQPEMTFPVIVKPAREDASVGIEDKSVVYILNDLKKRVRFIHQEFDQPALVEQYIDGRELNAAVIGNSRPFVLPISEIDFSGLTDSMHKIVTYAAKWLQGTIEYDGTKGVCPAPLSPDVEALVKETALRCYQLLGCRDYARVDFRLTENGELYVLEVNPNPDISDDAGFARSARAYGFTFPQLVSKIVESALERSK
jgi:D-alanine-D-alanine ligase